MIVRREIEDAMAAHAEPWRSHIEVRLVAQDSDALRLPPGRSKPSGTGHAVLAAREHVPGSFAVVNADDLYAPDSYALLHRHLSGPDPRHAVVGFAVAETLLSDGRVNRALLRTDADTLVDIAEGAVTPGDGELTWRPVDGGRSLVLSGSELVSMNCFGFRRSVFEALEEAWESFVVRGDASEAELLLPDIVRTLLRPPHEGVVVMRSLGGCIGVTHTDDLDTLRVTVAKLVNEGRLPSRPWPGR